MLLYQTDCSFFYFGGIFFCFVHGSILSRFGASSKPGAVQVERFFRDLTDQIISGSFASVKELADRIFTYLADRNQNPKHYVWNTKGEEILRKTQRARKSRIESESMYDHL